MRQKNDFLGSLSTYDLDYQKADGTIERIRGTRDPMGGPLINRSGNVLLWCPDRPRNWRQLKPSGIRKIHLSQPGRPNV